MTEHKGLPVSGYLPQTEEKVALVNEFKADEERILRKIDTISFVPGEDGQPVYDQRWLSIARTHMQEGFMALNRSVFRPARISLPEDAKE
jgi:hypothetical protein